MAKSANDKMMTRPQLMDGCSAYCLGLGDGSP